MQPFKNITFICIFKTGFKSDMDTKMEIKLYVKASLSMLNVACKEMFPNPEIHPKITTNHFIQTSKSHH